MNEKTGVELDTKGARRKYNKDLLALETTRRVTNYFSAAQIYLKENFLLREPLQRSHLKERLLGHWGTCPGLNFIYGHCNLLIKNSDVDMFLVVGPGHGAPSILSNLYLEGTLNRYYPDLTPDNKGIQNLIRGFSWPNGFPSHVNSQFPGSIHEGGELGYALAVSFGAIMDNPELIVTCVVGDGEAETGPTATAWHSYKYIDPKESGAVIPILHCNGFKISSSTIFGRMSNEELLCLFTGYGYAVRIVEDMTDIDADMAATMEWAYSTIRNIQKAAREGNPIFKPKWPMIIMRTPKGWTGVKTLHGKQIEGSFRSHDIPVKDPFNDEESFQAVKNWLESYHVQELIDENGKVKDEILETYPTRNERKMGMNKHTIPVAEPLDLPCISDFTCELDTRKRGSVTSSLTEMAGEFFKEVIRRNPTTFRIFSPDELVSNRLEEVLTVTGRNFQWEKESSNHDGRVIEVLSEHNCQGWMQGYTLTGRYAIFPSYETFLGIITTMMIQYSKFIKIANETRWRPEVPSLNYIQTSTLWRQEHNGFSHQNPMFTNNLVNMKSKFVRIYYPPDTNCFIYTLSKCLNGKNTVNLLVGTKKEIPNYLTMEEAKIHCEAGASIWKWVSTDEGVNPDVVIVGCGNETNFEAIAASLLLRRDCPQLRVRFVNVVDLMILDLNRNHPHAIDITTFEALFTKDKPIIFNFHGYPSLVRQLLFGRNHAERFHIHGYIEEGTTTTPFEMLVVNQTSRYHIAMDALKAASQFNNEVASSLPLLLGKYNLEIEEHQRYIVKYGKDQPHLENEKLFLQNMQRELNQPSEDLSKQTQRNPIVPTFALH